MIGISFFSNLRMGPYRTALLVSLDAFLLALSATIAFFIRFEGSFPARYISNMVTLAALNAAIVIPIYYWQRLYHVSLSFFSVRDLYRLLRASLFASIIILTAILILRDANLVSSFPRSAIIINFLVATILLSTVRIGKRMTREFRSSRSGKRMLIIGADEAGEQLARKMLSLPAVTVIGFLDNRPGKRRTTVHGIPVLGTSADLARIVHAHAIEEIIITESLLVRPAIDSARREGLPMGMIKILPSMNDIINGKLELTNIRDVSIEDLLGRAPVQIDTSRMCAFIQGRRVLVTGAAGSIGSHLCKHIAEFGPQQLIALDQNETGMFYLDREMRRQFPALNFQPVVADVCVSGRMQKIFSDFKPEIVFHAAAYKHVSVMEENPLEAVRNNIFGTLAVAQSARAQGVDMFIFISTDKAVQPVSVMGATKHIGEMICRLLHSQGPTRFCSVRFGNVLDSQGNVIEIFREQIKRGGPIEVTHPDMQRYFMVTSEACLLLMQAAALSKDGEIFCLDMGKPIKVYDLAKEMIKLAGYEPDVDIQILFSKPRPGERLSEELLIAGEIPTRYEKIFVARSPHADELASLPEKLKELQEALQEMDTLTVNELLHKIAPQYGTVEEHERQNTATWEPGAR